MSNDVRYPIGRYEAPGEISQGLREDWLAELKDFPAKLSAEIDHLTPSQLDTSYREGGWTIRQVVHHLADSHMNGYIRVKLALTEKAPKTVAYLQPAWGDLIDARTCDPAASTQILHGLHCRWGELFESLQEEDFARTYIHPQFQEPLTIAWTLGNFVWHGNHHLGQIRELKRRRGWAQDLI
ncbi:MAG: putative metal-dependent hydrolase [Dehalococcoidia bacterium]